MKDHTSALRDPNNPPTETFLPKRIFRTVLVVSALWATTALTCVGQQQAAVTTPQSLISQSISVMQGNTTAAPDVRLTGTVQYISGSQNELGTIAIISRPDGTARTDVMLSSGTHSHLRFPSGSASISATLDPNSTPQQIASHNLLVAANWYFPEHLLGLLGASTRIVASSNSTTCGPSAVCFVSQLSGPDPSSLAYFAKMSAMTVSLNSTSMQPTELDFVAHPNDQPNMGVQVKILYSDYQTVAGHLVPFHIQQFTNGSLYMDITLSSADLNASIAPSDLTIR